jgi:hypothetical protein
MGDSEFDSFFDDGADAAPAPAPDAGGGDPFGSAPAPDQAGGEGFDFGGDTAADAPIAMGEAPAMGNDMADMQSAFVTSANLSESPALT